MLTLWDRLRKKVDMPEKKKGIAGKIILVLFVLALCCRESVFMGIMLIITATNSFRNDDQ